MIHDRYMTNGTQWVYIGFHVGLSIKYHQIISRDLIGILSWTSSILWLDRLCIGLMWIEPSRNWDIIYIMILLMWVLTMQNIVLDFGRVHQFLAIGLVEWNLVQWKSCCLVLNTLGCSGSYKDGGYIKQQQWRSVSWYKSGRILKL